MKPLQEQHKPAVIEYLFPYKCCGNLATQVCCRDRAGDCSVCLIVLQACLQNLSPSLLPVLHGSTEKQCLASNNLECSQEESLNDLERSVMVPIEIFKDVKSQPKRLHQSSKVSACIFFLCISLHSAIKVHLVTLVRKRRNGG